MPARILYGLVIFLASCLLFVLEPMAGKWIVPQLGGSAAVWTTCLVFFQTMLFAGYLCAHWISTRLPGRVQSAAYGGLLLAGLVQGAMGPRFNLQASPAHPIVSVLYLLAARIGLPFLALSAASPLLQAWYAQENTATDGYPSPPYRLFAVSNFGSLAALMLYPWQVETHFSLRQQSLAWLVGLVFLVLLFAMIARRQQNCPRIAANPPHSATGAAGASPALPGRRVHPLWLVLPACSSLLLCAVTVHLSQDIAAIPLLWILPLIAYLLSFVMAFEGKRLYPRTLVIGLLVPVLGTAGYLLHDQRVDVPLWLWKWIPSFSAPQVAVPFFCAVLFLACLFCHGELYRLRPAPRQVTTYYLSIAAGGALGALLPGVVAPLVLSSNPDLGCGLLLTSALALAITWKHGVGSRLLWLAVCLAIATATLMQYRNFHRDAVFQERSFYGTLRVTQVNSSDGAAPYSRTLCHGAIIHGTQIFAAGLQTDPTSYYTHDSGAGLALELCCEERPRRVGVIGLGAGTLAAYGRRGDLFRFYEIDPLVERIARSYFTYLRDTAATIQIVPGDARVSLSAEDPQAYDVLVVDAFSGDAIPVHLLTSQAMEVYRRHLRPGGILAFHITNRFLELAPVVEQQAEHAGLSSVLVVTQENDDVGEYGSEWVLVTSNQGFLANQRMQEATQTEDGPHRLRLWTDDNNSLLPLLKKPEPGE